MRLTLNEMPVKCLDWLVSSRIEFLESMSNGHPTEYFAAHLPVMATWREGESFPVSPGRRTTGTLYRYL
jgi:hypothetical protein